MYYLLRHFHSFARSLCSAFAVVLAILMIGILTPNAAQARERSQAPDRQIIDVHLHALPLNSFPVDTLAGYERPESAQALRRQTINQLERFNITKAVTSSAPELLAAYKPAAPERII